MANQGNQKKNCCDQIAQDLGIKIEADDKGITLNLHPSDPKKASALKKIFEGLKDLNAWAAFKGCCSRC